MKRHCHEMIDPNRSEAVASEKIVNKKQKRKKKWEIVDGATRRGLR